MATLPSLSIDNIVLTIPIEPEQEQEIQDRLTNATNLFPGRVSNRKPRGRYKDGYEFTVSPDTVINIDANPARAGYSYLKLSYSPAQLSQDGTALLVDYLSYILGENYRELFHCGHVQEMVVGFDLREVILDNLWIYSTGRRDKNVEMVCNSDMEQQSICFGHKSTRKLVFTQEACELADAAPCVHVEYRYKKGNYILKEILTKLDDPLYHITIRLYAPMPDMDEVSSRLLFDACRIRGRSQVLAMYPDDERKSLKATMMNRFSLIDASKLRLGVWAQLRREIDTLIPIPAESDEAISVL